MIYSLVSSMHIKEAKSYVFIQLSLSPNTSIILHFLSDHSMPLPIIPLVFPGIFTTFSWWPSMKVSSFFILNCSLHQTYYITFLSKFIALLWSFNIQNSFKKKLQHSVLSAYLSISVVLPFILYNRDFLLV